MANEDFDRKRVVAERIGALIVNDSDMECDPDDYPGFTGVEDVAVSGDTVYVKFQNDEHPLTIVVSD